MDTLRLSELMQAAWRAVGQATMTLLWQVGHPEYKIAVKDLVKVVTDLELECEILKLPMSQIAARRYREEFLQVIDAAVRHNLVKREDVPKGMSEVLRTIVDETSLRVYFHLPESARALYSNRHPFGDGVASIFPKAGDDIEEAAKCVALERPTAAVFHSMRAMEFGLRKIITDSFGDTKFFDDVSTWGSIVSRIRKESNLPDASLSSLWVGKKDRLMKLAMLVQQFADAFRNPTMHCEKTYTLEQARDVFNASGAFLRRLAEDFGGGDDRPENPEDPSGPRNPPTETLGRVPGARQGGESQTEIRQHPPTEEEELGTSRPWNYAGCSATHTRSDRTGDA